MTARLRPLPDGVLPQLRWFRENAGRTVTWAEAKGEAGNLRASDAKAIYKPAGQPYALSIKLSAGGRYPNIGPMLRADGTWLAGYHQEGDDPADRDRAYTNRALMLNVADEQPAGVLQQAAPARPEYRVLGLALPIAWVDGLFVFEGASPSGAISGAGGGYLELLASTAGRMAADGGAAPADGTDDEGPAPWFDARARAYANIVRRQGQREFRDALLEAYSGRCVLTGTAVPAVLEAAHIDPYLGPHSNTVDNGLLLRSDVHALFDIGLLMIDSQTRLARLHTSVLFPPYAALDGGRLAEPADSSQRPRADRLQRRADAFADPTGRATRSTDVGERGGDGNLAVPATLLQDHPALDGMA